MTVLTRSLRQRGDQSSVYLERTNNYQVQTWSGEYWYGFTIVPMNQVGEEKRKQLTQLLEHPNA